MITKKDWQIINAALSVYEAEIVENPDTTGFDMHKEEFGDPEKTIGATRIRVSRLMLKKGIPL